MTITIHGGPELVAGLARVADGLEDSPQMDAAGKQAAEVLRADARGRAPRRTGRLAGSLVAGLRGGVPTVGTPVSYGLPVHFGVPSRNHRAQPFLAQAVAAQDAAVLAAYTRGVDNLLRAAV